MKLLNQQSVCVEHMTPEMQENIKESKKLFLDEENIAILNPIKTAIKNFEATGNYEKISDDLIFLKEKLK